jgi:hypothetical protein
LLRSTSGAQRASTHTGAPRRGPRWAAAFGAAVLALAIGVPSAAASTSSVITPEATVTPSTTSSYPWYSVETYYLQLVNCTRTGGWVLSDGTCKGYGSGHYSAYVKPLVLVAGISNSVSRPYAKLLATKGICSHFADHDPGYRLRRAGYYRTNWGENIGCRDGYSTAKAAVLASHLKFQAEKSTNGGHWKNIKNANYLYIGIGVWRYGTRTRLVTDFYR